MDLEANTFEELLTIVCWNIEIDLLHESNMSRRDILNLILLRFKEEKRLERVKMAEEFKLSIN